MTVVTESLNSDTKNQEQTPEKVSVVWTAAQSGRLATAVQVECALGRGFSGIHLIGNLGQVCEDGKERARSALERLGWVAPARRVVISVSPGALKIDHSHLDLAFAVALAGVQSDAVWRQDPSSWMFAAEVGIDGSLRPVCGIVAWATAAMERGLKGIIIASSNYDELACLSKLSGKSAEEFTVAAFDSLERVIDWLQGCPDLTVRAEPEARGVTDADHAFDFDDMDLSEDLAMVALVAASGFHSILMRGSPGTGKSMFARRLPSILPKMNPEDHIRALSVHSASSSRVADAIIAGIPPFRSPHHFTSVAAMMGTYDSPGELAMASGGILFLDELPEFRRDVLEGLREPLEDGVVHVSRAAGARSWTSKALLVAAANNCPCGWYGSRKRLCQCPASRLSAYRARISGPLLDRVDMHINMTEPADQVGALLMPPKQRVGQTARMRQKVLSARHMANERLAATGAKLNCELKATVILNSFGQNAGTILKTVERLTSHSVSSRSLIRFLRVARTIADVEESALVTDEHVERAWLWHPLIAARQRGEVPLN